MSTKKYNCFESKTDGKNKNHCSDIKQSDKNSPTKQTKNDEPAQTLFSTNTGRRITISQLPKHANTEGLLYRGISIDQIDEAIEHIFNGNGLDGYEFIKLVYSPETDLFAYYGQLSKGRLQSRVFIVYEVALGKNTVVSIKYKESIFSVWDNRTGDIVFGSSIYDHAPSVKNFGG
jgi:hypothetical protein